MRKRPLLTVSHQVLHLQQLFYKLQNTPREFLYFEPTHEYFCLYSFEVPTRLPGGLVAQGFLQGS